MDVVEIAREKLAELEIEAERLRQFIATYEALSGAESEVRNASAPVSQLGTNDDSKAGAIDSPSPKRGDKPSKIVKAAIQAIRDRGSPMTRSELVGTLENQGMVIGGADKNKNMGTILWRSKKFENVEGHGYWPLEMGEWALFQL
ncbi:hypothetical protein [Alteriqipengyuania sp. 357]